MSGHLPITDLNYDLPIAYLCPCVLLELPKNVYHSHAEFSPLLPEVTRTKEAKQPGYLTPTITVPYT